MHDGTVLRVGDAAIVGLPGEPFVEGQLAIKSASPAGATFVAHACSHYVGYIPTRQATATEGHETNARCTYWAKLAPDSLERIVAQARQMLADVFGGGAG